MKLRHFLLILSLIGLIAGCGGDRGKNVNKDKDKPKDQPPPQAPK